MNPNRLDGSTAINSRYDLFIDEDNNSDSEILPKPKEK